mgnify:CR=1 FL=1|jgi:hypothetical protein|tara:strand:- start:1199 stop:2212 length:1014 start_codon:yes stop_codon:yes gene_type:complete
MIKVKLSDNQNMKCFSGFIHTRDLLRDYSIDITDSNDYDYEFVDASQFLTLSLPLQESIDNGLENLSKKSGDYFLFHGGDSTSIMGVYEVFVESNAKYLFKKQLLSQEDYKEKTTLNKWFFGKGSTLDGGYNIPDDVYSRMKLTGYNVAHNWPHLQQMQLTNQDRDIDVCAIYQGILNNGNSDHGLRSDVLYTKHRKGAWDTLEDISETYNIVKGQTSPEQFVEIMKRSKVGISPFGMGELCYRDLELIQWGCLLLKPDMSKVITEPDFFKPMETYIPVKPDWSDLNETIENVLDYFEDYEYIIDNARQKVVEMYSYENVCMYWYNFFANLSGVESK